MNGSQVARQPIFDRDLRIYGFELLFRRSPLENFFVHHDADAAVESLIHDSLHVFGLDRLAPGRRAFLNVTRGALLSGLVRMLPRDRVVVELLESVPPDVEVVEACRSLKEAGYLLALDDFVYREELDVLVDLADIVKVDFLAGETAAATLPRTLAGRGIVFLAEKVETLAAYENARNWGYSLYQGNFFQPAEILYQGAVGLP